MANIISKTWNSTPTIGKIAIVGVGSLLLYKGAKKFLNSPYRVPLPQGGTGIPVTGYTPTGQPIAWSPEGLALELYNAMDGLFTTAETKSNAWDKLTNLPSNDMVVALYNYFNQKYGNGDSLTKWINDEYYSSFFDNSKQDALKRLQSLNLI